MGGCEEGGDEGTLFVDLSHRSDLQVVLTHQRHDTSLPVLQLLISKWDPAMSRDMLAHWLDLMNRQGWIAREQVDSILHLDVYSAVWVLAGSQKNAALLPISCTEAQHWIPVYVSTMPPCTVALAFEAAAAALVLYSSSLMTPQRLLLLAKTRMPAYAACACTDLGCNAKRLSLLGFTHSS